MTPDQFHQLEQWLTVVVVLVGMIFGALIVLIARR